MRAALPRLAGARRGFTLVELMVGVFLGAIVIGALFNMFITSSYVFQTQSQTSAVQTNLRYALQSVTDDLRRAGMLSTPNSRIDRRVCPKPAQPVHGLIHNDAVVPNVVGALAGDNPNIEPDELILSGNFTSPAAYPASVKGKLVTVNLPPWVGDPNRQPLVYTDDGFVQTFDERQFVVLSNSYGFFQVIGVDDVQANGAQRFVTLSTPPAFASSGMCGLLGTGDNAEISPLNFVHYAIARRDLSNNDDVRTDLIRQFVDDGMNPIAGTDMAVGEYIVDFQVWFMSKDGDGPNATIPADGDPLDDEGNVDIVLDNSANALPHRVRTAVVKICARADKEDRNWRHRTRNSDREPLLSFDLDGNVPVPNGAARVTCLSSEVEIVNFSLLNVTPGGGA